MAEGRRVFSDVKQSSPSGCKNLGKHGSRKGAVRHGLGRIARTAKRGVVYKAGVKEKGWNISGAVSYDEKGRVSEAYMTGFVQGDRESLLDTPIQAPAAASGQAALKTVYSYDSLDRVVKTVLPDLSEEHKSYGIYGTYLYTRTVDPLKNISITYTDMRGNTTAIEKRDTEGKLLTEARYEYDVLGQLLSAYPADEKYPVRVEYDMLGRKTALTASDSGRKEYTYNSVGELAWETDSVLRSKGQRISYEYDQFSRIKRIDYPYMKDTVYEYGESGAPYNRAGKVVRIHDETGEIEYKYGSLGEMTEETRTIEHINAKTQRPSTSAVMKYESDYLGRMQTIVYPDTEVILYGYDEGGQVVSITGNYQGLTTDYVKDIGYDEYGQRVFIEYGNGVKTEYSYNKERRWLANIRTQRRSETYQNIEYSFDKVGNVLGYKNDTTYYSTEQSYSYDGLYQLTEAQGTSINKPYGYVDYTSNYKQTFAFDTLGMGNMTAKISSVHNSPDRLLGENINYSLDYEYDQQYAHRAKRIGNRYYAYDGNGNVLLEQDEPIKPKEEKSYEIRELGENLYGVEYGWALENDEKNQQGGHGLFQRKYAWNEKNLLKESSDSRHTVFYRYGADGQRAVKSSEQSETLYFNTMWSWMHNSSAYNTDREIKHIYLGSERLVTRTNGAGSDGHTSTAEASTYYYHSDHLGSAHLITDYKGDEYERVEYTPYGEYWIEKRAPENKTLPFKFTGKERDEETGLYYYGARYLDAKTSRWLTTDPALGDFFSKEYNKESGGVYNTINLNLYHYSNNNPINYLDPDGKDWKGALRGFVNMVSSGFEVAGGVALMGAAGAGEIGSVGLATPVAAAVGVVGFAAFVDGMANFAFAASDFTCEVADCFTDKVPDGDLLPSNTGGLIGSGIDQKNGFDAQTEGKKGPAQVTGERINGAVSLGLTTAGYVNSVVESSSLNLPPSKDQIINEVSHQYDVYNNTKLMTEEK